MKFHEVMKRLKAKLVYSEKELIVGLKDPTLRDVIEVGEVLTETFGVSLDDVKVGHHDGHVIVSVPLEKPSSEQSEVTDDVERKNGFEYGIYGNVLKIRDRKISMTFDYPKVKELYDALPERVTIKDLMEVAKKIGLDLHYHSARLLMHFFSRYVEFDAEIIKEKNQLVLVKSENVSISDEVKKQMQIEKDVIGTPWKV